MTVSWLGGGRVEGISQKKPWLAGRPDCGGLQVRVSESALDAGLAGECLLTGDWLAGE